MDKQIVKIHLQQLLHMKCLVKIYIHVNKYGFDSRSWIRDLSDIPGLKNHNNFQIIMLLTFFFHWIRWLQWILELCDYYFWVLEWLIFNALEHVLWDRDSSRSHHMPSFSKIFYSRNENFNIFGNRQGFQDFVEFIRFDWDKKIP